MTLPALYEWSLPTRGSREIPSRRYFLAVAIEQRKILFADCNFLAVKKGDLQGTCIDAREVTETPVDPSEVLVILPLVLNVLPNDLLIHTDCGDEIPSAPEALLGECSFSGKCVMRTNGTLALEKPHDVSPGVLGRDAEDHVHMIGAGIALEDLNVLLFGKLADNFANLNSDWTKQDFFSVLWYDDHVVLTVPDHVIL